MIKKDVQRNEYLRKNFPEMWAAINHHKTHKNLPITFDNYLYLKDVYLDRSPYVCITKSTQVGITEYLVINALMKSRVGRGVFYVLPTYNLVGRFVKNRVDRSIEFTPFYKSLKKEKFTKYSESVSLKHIGEGSIAFVGSNASASFTEFPADDLIIDELDECDQENLAMAWERLSASKDKRVIKAGNPTIKDFGIDAEFNVSDKKQWRISCSSCGKWIQPDFFNHVVREVGAREYIILDDKWDRDMKRDINCVCDKCGKPYDRFGHGEWVREDRQSKISGYQISKMFSTNVRITELMDRFEKGLTDDSKLQRFYNGDLGQAYTASGSKITKEMLDDCRADYLMPVGIKEACLMGIDVGTKLVVRINQILPDGKLRAVFIGKVDHYEEIVALHKAYNVVCGVVDSQPEQRLAKKICRLKGMFRAFYGDKKKETIDIKNRIVHADRTSSLDEVKGIIISQHLILPKNASGLSPIISKIGMSEYYYEMGNSTRVFDEKKNSYKWVEGALPDHYFHAENYCILARKILTRLQ